MSEANVSAHEGSLTHFLDACMSQYGDRPLWQIPETITYAEALDRVRKGGVRLREAGLAPGDRVLLQRENDTAWPIDFLSILAAGGVAVPLDPHLTEGETKHQQQHCGARWEITPDGLRSLEAPDVPPLPAGTAIILYSSGTTGTPKAVPLTHENLLANVRGMQERFPLSTDDRMLCILPFHHTFALTGCLLYPIASGAALGLASPLKLRDLFATWLRLKPTLLLAVPAVLRLLQKMSGRGAPPAEGLRGIITGGAAAPRGVMDALGASGFTVFQGYGMTETAPVICASAPDLNRLGAVGKPLRDVEVKIASADQPDGEGEILVRGPTVMPGYYRDAERTADTIRNGWLHTGDLGRFDADGFLYVCGRSKNLILSDDGKNIYPEEIEGALAASPHFAECCVLGRPLGDGRERIAAVVVASDALRELPEAERTGNVRDEIKRLCDNLAPYKRVQEIFLHDDPLPKTPTMKVRRPELVAWLKDRAPL